MSKLWGACERKNFVEWPPLERRVLVFPIMLKVRHGWFWATTFPYMCIRSIGIILGLAEFLTTEIPFQRILNVQKTSGWLDLWIDKVTYGLIFGLKIYQKTLTNPWRRRYINSRSNKRISSSEFRHRISHSYTRIGGWPDDQNCRHHLAVWNTVQTPKLIPVVVLLPQNSGVKATRVNSAVAILDSGNSLNSGGQNPWVHTVLHSKIYRRNTETN